MVALITGCTLLLALVIGSLPYWIPLPYPSGALVEEIPDDKWPTSESSISELCGSNVLELKAVQRLFEGQVVGSESVSVSPYGDLTMCDKYGNVWTATPDASTGYKLNPKPVAYIGPGRPLGFHHDSHGNLVICDSVKGLVMLEDSTQKFIILSNRVSDTSPLLPGAAISYANDLDIAHDGSIYFSDSSHIKPAFDLELGHWDTFDAYVLTMMQGRPSGKLLRYDPASGTTTALLDGLWYANGVALSAAESFVVVVETCSRRVNKFWLQGPKKGQVEILVDGLPGYPDGVTRAEDGNFWVSLLAPQTPILKAARSRLARILMSWVPAKLRPLPKKWGAVLKVSPEGQVVGCMLDLNGTYIADIAAVTLDKDRIFFGNLRGNYVSVLDSAHNRD